MFTDARIICINADDNDYHKPQEVERGHPEFVMSRGALLEFARCPSRWKNGYEAPDSEAKRLGSLFDCMVLAPQRFKDRYATVPEKYLVRLMKCPECGSVTNSGRCAKCKCDREQVTEERLWNWNANECAEWGEARRKEGKEPVKMADIADATEAFHRLKADEIIASWLDACDTCVWVEAFWEDKATGLRIRFKVLIDFMPNPQKETLVSFRGCIGDLKRTCNGDPTAWSKWCYKAGYHKQGAIYSDVLSAIYPEDDPRRIHTFHFILSETYRPFEPGRRILSQDFITLGRNSYQQAMENYCRCVASEKWPSYDDNDEAKDYNGWTRMVPNPWYATEEQFAPHYQFDAPTERETEPTLDTDDIPTP